MNRSRSTAAEKTNHRFTVPAICGFLLLAVVLVFGQTVQHGFINFDDPMYVYENPQITGGLTAHGIAWAFTASHAANWHPLTWLSHMLDCQIYGLHAGGHHLTSVLLHATSSILLFLVLWRMTGDLWPSAFVAAVFAIHPLRAESVAWVSERKGLLSGLFFIAVLGAYVGYVRRPFSVARYLVVMGLFALGLMAKPALVTLPFVLLLLDYWPLKRITAATSIVGNEPRDGGNNWRWLVVEKLPLLALAAASCVVTPLAQGQAVVSLEKIPFYLRVSNALVSYITYVGHFFYPVGLAIFYPHPGPSLPMWKPAVALVLLVAISTAAWRGRRKYPYLFVGWFWYVGMLVPMIGLVQVGTQAMTDRYSYLPLIGLGIAIAWGLAYLPRSHCPTAAKPLAVSLALPTGRNVRICGAASTLVILVLAACARQQTSYWRDSETLWRHALACTTRNALAHNNLGITLAGQGKTDAAIEQYQKALEINPNYTDMRNNLGVALASRGQLDEAIANYQRALDVDPNLANAHHNLAVALARRGQIDAAIDQDQQALRIRPDFAEAHYSLGNVLADRGQFDAAVRHFRSSLAIKPELADAHYNLGVALDRQGRIAEAVTEWRESLRLQPQDVGAMNQLAWTLATCPEASIRNGLEAVDLARHAVELSNGRDPEVLGALAAAYAEVGRFAEAVEAAGRAMSIASDHGDKALADDLSKQVEFYRAGSPFHESRAAPGAN